MLGIYIGQLLGVIVYLMKIDEKRETIYIFYHSEVNKGHSIGKSSIFRRVHPINTVLMMGCDNLSGSPVQCY
jgi:hypothetical protein